MEHPNEIELAVAAARTGAGGTEEEVKAHLEAGCEACGRKVSFWRRIVGTMRAAARAPAPPPDAVRRATAIFARPPRPRPGPFPLPAELVFDSRPTPAPAAARSGLVAERHLLYSLPGFDVDMRIRFSRGRLALGGQILPEEGGFVEPSRLALWLHGAGGRTSSLHVTEFGEFEARDLPAGEQTLEIVLDHLASFRLGFDL